MIFLNENDITLVWRVKQYLKIPSFVTTDTIYLRFIGNRNADQRRFGLYVQDKEDELKEYVIHIQDAMQNNDIKDVIVTFNNNYAGFSPQLANDFLRLMYAPRE